MKLAAIFPGQGSQVVGMGVDVVARFPQAQQTFSRASAVLGYDLLDLVKRGPEERLRETRYSQPAIFTANIALYVAARLERPPVVSAGHSFGEICSLTIAGALSLEAATALVDARAKAMQRAAERSAGAMSAVLGMEADSIVRIADRVNREGAGTVQLANFNAPTQIVISGDETAVRRAGVLLADAGAKRIVPLNVSGAWHSRLMEPAVSEFANAVEETTFHLPQCDVVSNVDAAPYRTTDQMKSNLIRSISNEVRWHEAAQTLLRYRPDIIIEFGATPVLAPLMRRMPGAPPVKTVSDTSGIEKLAEELHAQAAETGS